jgi:hypothetical protein
MENLGTIKWKNTRLFGCLMTWVHAPRPPIASVGEPESRKRKREGRVLAIVVVSADKEGRGRSQIRRQQKLFPLQGKILLEYYSV